MATLIPALDTCTARMAAGERRLAERLQHKLDADTLPWFGVPVGAEGPALPGQPGQKAPRPRPQFLLLHPAHGLLVLETRDWPLGSIIHAGREQFSIREDGTAPTTVPNPLEHARQLAQHIAGLLQHDPQLVQAAGRWKGLLRLAWSYGVVLTGISREHFDRAGLGRVLDTQRVVCRDEMTEVTDASSLQARLWAMFPLAMRGGAPLSTTQVDRVRWNLFPELRIAAPIGHPAPVPDDPKRAAAVAAAAMQPSRMRMMDVAQERLARCMAGEDPGHRVIHGVAGSGKTMLLAWRAEHLARSATPGSKPVLVLCFSEPLAVLLQAHFVRQELDTVVQVNHFPRWCHQQLMAHQQELPDVRLGRDAVVQDMVLRVITGVERGDIPAGQYRAVLVDEAHDFPPEWLKLATQMADPATNSLLLLYDDAQNIYARKRAATGAPQSNSSSRRKPFSLKNVGIRAEGERTTLLSVNYRNTKQIFDTARQVAGSLLAAPNDENTEQVGHDVEDDPVPLIEPTSGGRNGYPPKTISLPTAREEADKIADIFIAAYQHGHAWSDMAILARNLDTLEACADTLALRKLPHELRRQTGDYNPGADTIKLMTMHACKGLEFGVVAIAGGMPVAGEDAREDARLFYVGVTRATDKLVLGGAGTGSFSNGPGPVAAP
ncbi:MAG: 3'-5' exonuclease [Pseudomonadota bacterium]